MTEGPAYRIAVRQEGAWINAYVAQMDTMSGAIKVASLLKSAVDVDRVAFDEWLNLLQHHVDRMYSHITGSHAVRFTRNKPDSLEPIDSPAPPPPSASPEPFAWPAFMAPIPTPESPPATAFQSGGGGDFSGAGASGSWDSASSPAAEPASAPADSSSCDSSSSSSSGSSSSD